MVKFSILRSLELLAFFENRYNENSGKPVFMCILSDLFFLFLILQITNHPNTSGYFVPHNIHLIQCTIHKRLPTLLLSSLSSAHYVGNTWTIIFKIP